MANYSIDQYLKLAEGYINNNYKECTSEKIPSEVLIANKYNFLKMDKEIKNKFDIIEDLHSFSIFPTKNIIFRWLRYVDWVNSKLKNFNKEISIENSELANLLLRLSKISDGDQKQRKDLLRSLGAICEDVLIGPYSIVVDLIHSCNTDCLHCWLHSPHNKRKDSHYLKGKMDVEGFRSIVEKAREISTEKICLLANGEPLMHPEIKKIVDICYINKLEFETITNGVFMTDSLSRFLVDSGVTIITVSLPAATAKSYKQICPKSPIGDFDKVKKNIKALIAYRNNIGNNNVKVNMTHVIHNLNCYDLPKFVEMDIELGVDAVLFKIIQLDEANYFLKLNESQINYFKINLPQVITRLKAKGIRTDELANTYLDFYENTQGLRTKDFFAEKGCLTGWSFCNIQLDGEVLFCCGNKMVDSLHRQSLDKIWFSDKYNFYRKAAKHMEDNKNIEFTRSEKLFDDKCHSCENINEHFRIVDTLRKYSLLSFL